MAPERIPETLGIRGTFGAAPLTLLTAAPALAQGLTSPIADGRRAACHRARRRRLRAARHGAGAARCCSDSRDGAAPAPTNRSPACARWSTNTRRCCRAPARSPCCGPRTPTARNSSARPRCAAARPAPRSGARFQPWLATPTPTQLARALEACASAASGFDLSLTTPRRPADARHGLGAGRRRRAARAAAPISARAEPMPPSRGRSTDLASARTVLAALPSRPSSAMREQQAGLRQRRLSCSWPDAGQDRHRDRAGRTARPAALKHHLAALGERDEPLTARRSPSRRFRAGRIRRRRRHRRLSAAAPGRGRSPRCRAVAISAPSSMRWRRRSPSSTPTASWCSPTAPMRSCGGSIRKWLKPGMDERAILDKLRTDGMLPTEPDYQAWRARHLPVLHAARRRARASPGICPMAAPCR